jgi:hypothetical protein
MRGKTRRAFGSVVAIAVATSIAIPWSATVGVTAHAAPTTTQKWKLSTGVTLTRIRYPDTPNEVRILTILPQKGPRLDVTPAGSAFPMYKLPSAMAAQNGSIAGVNGDFATRYGAPVHDTMIDGELWTSGTSGGPAFAVTHDGVNAYVGMPKLRMNGRMRGEEPMPIAGWNAGAPTSSTVQAYTARGGTGVKPPGTASPETSSPIFCAVRLTPVSGYGWSGAGRTAITRLYRSKVQVCQKRPLGPGTESGNVVLATKGKRGARSTWLRSLVKGTKIKLSYGFTGWPGVTDVIGGTPMLLQKAKNVAPKYYSGADNLLWYNPRTSVGVNRGCVDTDPGTTCKIWVVTVDGRQASWGWSKGMQLPRLAEELKALGARFAMNLDGGGSTAMWVKKRNTAYCLSDPAVGGCLVNRPSASFGERVTIDGLSVLPSADPNTPRPLH